MRVRMSKNIWEFSRKFSDLPLIQTPSQGYGTPTIKPLPDVVPAEHKRPPPRTESSASGAVVSKFVNSPTGKVNRCDSCECQLNDESLCLAEWSSDGSVTFKLADHSSVTLKFSTIWALFKLELILRRETPNFHIFFHSLVNLVAQEGRKMLLCNLNDKEWISSNWLSFKWNVTFKRTRKRPDIAK